VNDTKMLEMGDRFVLPGGVSSAGATPIGMNVVTGGGMVTHQFTFHDKATGKKLKVRILADDFTSQGEIEQQAGEAMERWLGELRGQAQRKAGKHTPSHAERLEVAGALKEFRAHLAHRKASSNNLVYFPGVEVPSGISGISR